MSMSISEVQRFRDLRLRIEALEARMAVFIQIHDNKANEPKPRTKPKNAKPIDMIKTVSASKAGIRL